MATANEAVTSDYAKNQSTTTNGEANASAEPLPVVIAGGGCVGLFLALLLVQSSIPNKVIVIEPSPPSPESTRAMAHQPLIFPLFASAHLMPDLTRLGSFSSGLCFRTSASNGSKLIAGKVFKEGEKAQLLLPQWKFQELLIGKVKEAGGQKETSCVSVQVCTADTDADAEADDHSKKSTTKEDEEPETIKATYLVGADGAHSFVRRTLNLPFDGDTLPTMLVATDIVFDFHAHGFYDANFIIDPTSYGLIGRINTSGLWRVSYGVSPSLTWTEIQSSVHSKLRHMLPNGGLDDANGGAQAYRVKRVAPYRAQQRVVEALWREGARVGVLGDAAHLTNPYAGLGLASGIADASSLAQVLIRILSPSPSSASSSSSSSSSLATDPATLLGSWSTARRNTFLNVVDRPSRAAYQRVQSKVDTEEEIEQLLARDPLVGALKKGMPMMPPSLVTKGEDLEGW
ncbi:FAD/NAD(P)-binding domain-containing protein [Pleomassaria siparia CBS 279.74]|uniref:FAD/NAD(P)-binding domain-containing protein n=1 Tax=Pleomassaria siparia CBS 279.74 TaxID=1314801 RepID=A0A6G1JX82_9PLEO|nr:FAD/NAD(P)-binding domain-containing protein [Pleomassaria siparia CBS 279.74]